jgi:hypothetical protein
MARAGGAEEVPVPASVQVPIFLKILTFDRNFEKRVRTQLTIGIVYVEEDPASRQARDELVKVLKSYDDKTIKGLPITYFLVPYTTEPSIMESAKSQGINVFYIAPGNAAHLAALLKISQKHRITTISGVPQYVEQGVAVGLDLNSDNKTRILINLKSSRMEGAAFDANLLRLVTVLQQ